MLNLELKEGVGVFTPGDEQVGKISGFVLDPNTNEVTHIIVQKGWLLPEDKVVPFEMIRSATGEKVVLNENIDNFNELPSFEESHYIQPRDGDLVRGENRDTVLEAETNPRVIPTSGFSPAYYWYPPQGYLGNPVGYYGWPIIETRRNIPADTIPLREGVDVISSDGKHVGNVERLFVEPNSTRATHFVISQGLFFKDRKLAPAHWVKSVSEDKIHLSVTSGLLEQLPTFEG